jgi:RHS repeat-associated protein
MSYTPVNLLSTYTPPALASLVNPQTVYEYDPDRNLSTVTRPDGVVLTYGYDTAGRLQTITAPTSTITRSYTNRQLSEISSSADGTTIDFTYDGQTLRRAAWSGPIAATVARTYDADFRLNREVVIGSGIADGRFGYDSDGLVICASPSSCDVPVGADALTLTYDAANGLLNTTNLRSVSDALTYSAFGELATESAITGSTALLSETYDAPTASRDALGRILHKTETLQGTTTAFDYTYDSSGRLKTVAQNGTQTASYGYDANGNRLSLTTPSGTTSATYDAQDRLLTYGTLTYTYTANGELETKTDSATSAITAYQYDAFGNLTRVDLPNGDVVQYLVDGMNRRIGKKKNGTLVKLWLYSDALHPIEELDGSGNLLSRFIYASGKNSPDFMVQNNIEYRILSDQLGSPRLVANASTGAIVQRMREDEFGNVVEDTSPGDTPFGFAGGLYDADTGLVRFGARDYDPVVGRWISKDPIRFDGGQANIYAYVNNDPINAVDLAGTGAEVLVLPLCVVQPEICAAVAAGVAGAVILGVVGNEIGKLLEPTDDGGICKPEPAPQPDCASAKTQCIQACVDEGMLGVNKDLGGNYGLQECIRLCMESLGC